VAGVDGRISFSRDYRNVCDVVVDAELVLATDTAPACPKAVEHDHKTRSAQPKGKKRLFATGTRNTLAMWGLFNLIRSLKLGQILGMSLALLLFGSGVWANVSGSSLSQNKGAWVSYASR